MHFNATNSQKYNYILQALGSQSAGGLKPTPTFSFSFSIYKSILWKVKLR